MTRIAFMGVAALLAGCATTAPTAESIGPQPANYQDTVRAHIKEAFFDPYSLRDVSISQPIPVNAVFDGVTPIPHSGWMVCLKANGKNRFGAYTGLQLTGFLFQNGELGVTISGPEYKFQIEDHCKPANFQDFDTQVS